MTTLLTVLADAPAGTLQTIATEVLGVQPGVTAGRWASVDLPEADAQRLAARLREGGYRVRVR